MLRGLYTAAAGMVTQQKKHDTVTHNIANLETPGFKKSEAVSRSFPEFLLANMQKDQHQMKSIGHLNTGVFVEEILPVFAQGDIHETNHPFDFALVSMIEVEGMTFDNAGKFISPEGEVIYRPQAFFTVINENGDIRYTRNGKFTVNAVGELVTHEGYRVLNSEGEPIVLRDPESDMPIERLVLLPGGALMTESGATVASLGLTRIEHPYRLIPEGLGLFRNDADDSAQATPMTVNEQVQVRQGFVERANVDPTQSMVEMNLALRAYEANQVVIQYYDRSLDKAVNEIGRI